MSKSKVNKLRKQLKEETKLIIYSLKTYLDYRTFNSLINRLARMKRIDIITDFKKQMEELRETILTKKKIKKKVITLPKIKKQKKERIKRELKLKPIFKKPPTEPLPELPPEAIFDAPPDEPLPDKPADERLKNEILFNIPPPDEPLPPEGVHLRTALIKDVSGYFSYKRYFYNNVNNMLDMFNAVNDATTRFINPDYLSIFYINRDTNKIKMRTVTMQSFDPTDYYSFEELINSVTRPIGEGRYKNAYGVGSDSQYDEEDQLILHAFDLKAIKKEGEGSSDKMIFKTVGIDSSKKMCAYESLLYCMPQVVEILDMEERKKLKDFKNLKRFIEKNGLPINLMLNTYTLKKDYDLNKIKMEKIRVDGDGENSFPVDVYGFKLTEDLLNNVFYPVYYTYDAYNEFTIIYDHNDKHYDVITNNKIEFCDNLYYTRSKYLIKNNQYISKIRQAIKNDLNSKSGVEMEQRYLTFDYETVIDFKENSLMKEYSLSALDVDEAQLKKLSELDEAITKASNNKDKKQLKKELKEFKERHCVTFAGFDCSRQFIDYIVGHQDRGADGKHGVKYTLIGFNNSNFDNHILVDAILNYRGDDNILRNKTMQTYETEDGLTIDPFNSDVNVERIFYNGSQIINFEFNGRHDTYDLRKHLTGSLKYNCESFKVGACKKLDFDHNKAQELYEKGELIDYMKNNKEIREYNEHDVLSTAIIFYRYKKAILDVLKNMKYKKQIKGETVECNYAYEFKNKFDTIKTVGRLIMSICNLFFEKNNIKVPKFKLEDIDIYDNILKYKCAGRVEMFNGVKKIFDEMVSMDVCSLYPYVLAVLDVYYPCGKNITKVDMYRGPDFLGFYRCDIDQSNLKEQNLPKIYPKKTDTENRWDHDEILKDYTISSVMIEQLRKYGCTVTVYEGIIFPEKMRSCDMFTFILEFMKGKNEQDHFKKIGSPNYNPALREVLKLIMNAISGKLIERIHLNKIEEVASLAEFAKIEATSNKINTINAYNNRVFIDYEKNIEEVFAKEQKPVFMGVLIYDYAKCYMYDYAYSKIGLSECIYTDTDAIKFLKKIFESWVWEINKKNIIVPHWDKVELYDERYKTHKIYEPNSKVFGAFEDELNEISQKIKKYNIQDYRYLFYCLQKKTWAYMAIDKNNEIIKVVDGDKTDALVKFRFKGVGVNSLVLDLNEDFINKKIKYSKKNDTYRLEYNLLSAHEQDKLNYKINKYYNEEKQKQLQYNVYEAYDRLYNEHELYLLCNSFKKIVKNTKHNVGFDEIEKFNTNMNKIQVVYTIKKITISMNEEQDEEAKLIERKIKEDERKKFYESHNEQGRKENLRHLENSATYMTRRKEYKLKKLEREEERKRLNEEREKAHIIDMEQNIISRNADLSPEELKIKIDEVVKEHQIKQENKNRNLKLRKVLYETFRKKINLEIYDKKREKLDPQEKRKLINRMVTAYIKNHQGELINDYLDGFFN